MKRIKYSFLILFCLWLSYSANAQESKFKALFIYKFSEYIEWPSSPSKIVVGVAGETDVYNQLSKFAASKENLEVISIMSAEESSKCNIIFLPSSHDKELSSYVSNINKRSILVVSENKSLVNKGADIGFYLEDGKLRFLINKESIENKSMVPSSKLLALGTSI